MIATISVEEKFQHHEAGRDLVGVTLRRWRPFPACPPGVAVGRSFWLFFAALFRRYSY
jgi:hypothetical protein